MRLHYTVQHSQCFFTHRMSFIASFVVLIFLKASFLVETVVPKHKRSSLDGICSFLC